MVYSESLRLILAVSTSVYMSTHTFRWQLSLHILYEDFLMSLTREKKQNLWNLLQTNIALIHISALCCLVATLCVLYPLWLIMSWCRFKCIFIPWFAMHVIRRWIKKCNHMIYFLTSRHFHLPWEKTSWLYLSVVKIGDLYLLQLWTHLLFFLWLTATHFCLRLDRLRGAV